MMDQKIFWSIGFLIIVFCNFGKGSIEDNEITPLDETSKPELGTPDLKKFGFNVNLLVDAVLAATRTAIHAGHEDQVPLDDVDSEFNISLKIATLTAHVKLINGTLAALNSIERRGDAKIIPRIFHREVDVVATLGLKTAVAEFYYYLQILGTHPNGNLTAVVGDNAVSVRFALNWDAQGCHLQLSELKMTRLSNVDVTLTGLYPFDTWASRLATQITSSFDGQLAKKIETTLRFYIQQEIEKMPCAKGEALYEILTH